MRPAPNVASLRCSLTAQRQLPPSLALAGPSKGSTRPQASGRPGPTEHGPTCATDTLHRVHGDLTRPPVPPRGPICLGLRSATPSDVGGGASQLDTARVSAAMPGPLTGGGTRLRRRPCRLGPQACTGTTLSRFLALLPSNGGRSTAW
ncbi:hypothetical protein NDU88_004652 [Pleurodeles waltl]|uniref:Uncharacterized protein n=1 Tax=Pleurodeles waltl TaxID=8319 RepID=A0AAV7SJJ4_PLEWA|nr:hypothetical protein NDU88_004652 [Pleurodeles waltl]